MKNLGTVQDPKDVATKEYVDTMSTGTEYTEEEIRSLWDTVFTS